jgi:DNA-binding phage protein
MGRTVTSKKQKKSGTKFLKAHEPNASKELKNPKLVQETLLECIKNGDLDSFREVLIAYLVTANKTNLAKKAGIGRQTLYDLIDLKKKFNPELSTVSAVIHAIAA